MGSMWKLLLNYQEQGRGGREASFAFCLRGTRQRRDQVYGFLSVLSERQTEKTRAALPDDFSNTLEITDSRQLLIQSEMGMQSCPLESLILLRQAATPGGDNKKGKQSRVTLLWSVQIHFSQQLHGGLIRQ